jgi:hypothetical protein
MANEQIKQLIGQTLDEKFAGTWSVMDLQDLTKFADRFAQLIVQECMDVVAKKCASPTAYNALAEHFGVEK